MHELLNTKTGKITSIPSDIDELDPEQYLQYLVLISSEKDIPALKRKLFQISVKLSVPWSFMFMKRQIKENIFDNTALFIDLMDSFFDIEDVNGKRMYTPHIKSGKNLLPTFYQYKGPEDMLNNITWGDFIDCMNLINSYQLSANSDQDIDISIDEIFNILYKVDPDYNKQFIAKEVPYYVKLHAFNFFSTVFELISSGPIPINGEEIDFRILFSGKGNKKKDDKTGWAGLVFSIAESGVFGKTNEVNQEKFWNVLIYLYKCTFESENMKTNGKLK